MKKFRCIILCTVLMSLQFISTDAQEIKPGVKVLGRATQSTIRLRWAPTTPTVWQLGNKYGYTIERVTLSEGKKVFTNPVRSMLNKVPLKPAVQQQWERSMDSDDYIAIAAQAIFGETFQIDNSSKSDIVKVINKAKELESRFSFALFSCDQSIKAAELSGLYFEDETIAPGTKYLYRIYANIPREIIEADTGFVYLGLGDYQPLPKPLDLKAEFADKLVMLSWNGLLFERIYNSFWVERSDDNGQTFERISDEPVVNTYNGERPKTNLIFRSDSLESNSVKYQYRVIGITAFGEYGPPSDTVSGLGKPSFTSSPSIQSHLIHNNSSVELSFRFPQEAEPMVRSFDLTRVDPTTKAIVVVRGGLSATTRSVIDELPRSSNYYVVCANDVYGRVTKSFPYLVQLEDSIPPVAPVELKGRIDTLGRVFLEWKANAEEDLVGYTIYRSNFNSEEFVQVPGLITTSNSYVDTIPLKNLSEKIYYKISAMDKRYNSSKFSELLTLQKPDLIPPVPPVCQSIRRDSIGVALTFIRSGSQDVVQHLLYRRAEDENEWTLIKSFQSGDTLNQFLDKDVKHKVMYAYTCLALDDAGLESIPAEPVTIRWIADNPFPSVESIFYTVDRTNKTITLTWKYDQPSVDKFLIYRSNNGGPLKLYKSLHNGMQEFEDSYKSSDLKVEYRVVASFSSGEKTKISKPISIEM